MSGTRPRAGANSYIQAQRRAKGLHFEQIIEAGCDYYRARDLADIEKKISKEVQLDRKYALAKEKQRIVKEIKQCQNSKK